MCRTFCMQVRGCTAMTDFSYCSRMHGPGSLQQHVHASQRQTSTEISHLPSLEHRPLRRYTSDTYLLQNPVPLYKQRGQQHCGSAVRHQNNSVSPALLRTISAPSEHSVQQKQGVALFGPMIELDGQPSASTYEEQPQMQSSAALDDYPQQSALHCSQLTCSTNFRHQRTGSYGQLTHTVQQHPAYNHQQQQPTCYQMSTGCQHGAELQQPGNQSAPCIQHQSSYGSTPAFSAEAATGTGSCCSASFPPLSNAMLAHCVMPEVVSDASCTDGFYNCSNTVAGTCAVTDGMLERLFEEAEGMFGNLVDACMINAEAPVHMMHTPQLSPVVQYNPQQQHMPAAGIHTSPFPGNAGVLDTPTSQHVDRWCNCQFSPPPSIDTALRTCESFVNINSLSAPQPAAAACMPLSGDAGEMMSGQSAPRIRLKVQCRSTKLSPPAASTVVQPPCSSTLESAVVHSPNKHVKSFAMSRTLSMSSTSGAGVHKPQHSKAGVLPQVAAELVDVMLASNSLGGSHHTTTQVQLPLAGSGGSGVTTSGQIHGGVGGSTMSGSDGAAAPSDSTTSSDGNEVAVADSTWTSEPLVRTLSKSKRSHKRRQGRPSQCYALAPACVLLVAV